MINPELTENMEASTPPRTNCLIISIIHNQVGLEIIL